MAGKRWRKLATMHVTRSTLESHDVNNVRVSLYFQSRNFASSSLLGRNEKAARCNRSLLLRRLYIFPRSFSCCTLSLYIHVPNGSRRKDWGPMKHKVLLRITTRIRNERERRGRCNIYAMLNVSLLKFDLRESKEDLISWCTITTESFVFTQHS